VLPGAAGPTEYGFTGREPDETGLVYYRARYYEPTLGRFVSMDPAGMPDGVNRYAYVGNDPVGMVDPSGMVALVQDISMIERIRSIGELSPRSATGGSMWSMACCAARATGTPMPQREGVLYLLRNS